MKKGTVHKGDFIIISIPIPYKITLINTYYNYKNMGLSEEEIVRRLKRDLDNWKKSGFPFVLVFIYKGNKVQTNVKIPSDLREYVYLENNYGVKGEIKFQKVPLKRTLNAKNRKVIVNLIFSTIDKKDRFLLDASRITLHIKDIFPGNTDLRISYKYPCDIDFSDAPQEVKYILNRVIGSTY